VGDTNGLVDVVEAAKEAVGATNAAADVVGAAEEVMVATTVGCGSSIVGVNGALVTEFDADKHPDRVNTTGTNRHVIIYLNHNFLNICMGFQIQNDDTVHLHGIIILYHPIALPSLRVVVAYVVVEEIISAVNRDVVAS
jgi:hypothetical protein